MMEKLGLGFVSISMEELLAEIAKESYEPNEYTDLFRAQAFDGAEVEKALYVYGAFQRLVEKYALCGVSVLQIVVCVLYYQAANIRLRPMVEN